MVLHAYCDADPTKGIEEFEEKCGFEASRLLSKMYDPYNVDTHLSLIHGIPQISTWSVKGIEQAQSMMGREGPQDSIGKADKEG